MKHHLSCRPTLNELTDAIIGSEPGDQIVYLLGETPQRRPKIFNHAWAMYERGLVLLVQRRVSPTSGLFQYIAVRTQQPYAARNA